MPGGREGGIRVLKVAYLLLGLLLFGWVLLQTDIEAVGRRVIQMGWGMVLVLAIYFFEFLLDAVAWGLTVGRVPIGSLWMFRFWKVRMVGEAFNQVTPLATVGGEPVKAHLLKEHYGVPYRDGVASLIVVKTTVMMALLVFLACGFGLILHSERLPRLYKQVAGYGLAAFTLGLALFFLAQRVRMTSYAGPWLRRWGIGPYLNRLLHKISEVDDLLAHFYSSHRKRFMAAITLALTAWLLGLPELYFTMVFLGHPIDFGETWMIESIAQLVRLGTFFIPGSLGAQEGAFYLVFGAMGMDPALGLAVSMVRRVREVVWIVWGLALGWAFAFQQRTPENSGPSKAQPSERD